MKFIAILLLCCYQVSGQDVVRWEFRVEKLDGKRYAIQLIPVVKEPWHIYALDSPEGAGMPTRIQFLPNAVLQTAGTLQQEGKVVQRYEKVFDVTVKFLTGKVKFVQVVELKAAVKTKIQGTIQYMACTDEQCTRPMKVPFSIPVG